MYNLDDASFKAQSYDKLISKLPCSLSIDQSTLNGTPIHFVEKNHFRLNLMLTGQLGKSLSTRGDDSHARKGWVEDTNSMFKAGIQHMEVLNE